MNDEFSIQLTINTRLRSHIDAFCRECIGVCDEPSTEIIGCKNTECKLYPVRLGTDLRKNPDTQTTKAININPSKTSERSWTVIDNKRLMDWRSESPQKPWWWIAVMLRRTELSCKRQFKIINGIENPPNPLDGLEL